MISVSAEFASLRRTLRIALLAAICVVPARTWAEQLITLTGDPWPPFVQGEMGQEAHSGVAVDIARAIFARLDGYRASFPLIPWKRALREVEMGTMDGIVLLLKTAERERYMTFTEPVFEARSEIWFSKRRMPGGFEWQSLADLGGKRAGITRGYSYGEELDTAFEAGSLDVTRAPTVKQLFAMLVNGRVDLAFATDAVAQALAEQYPEAQLAAAARPTAVDIYHIGLSRRSPAVDLIPRINAVIAELKRDGTIRALLRAH